MAVTIYATRGLPGSGKTHWAIQMIAENPGAFKRTNKDDLRAMIDGGKWSPANEKFVLSVRDSIIISALREGKHVIVDDTHGHPKHLIHFEKIATEIRKEGRDCAVKVQDFTHVPLEECIARDLKRERSVGERVIRKMWREFFAPPITRPEFTLGAPPCVIVDIDGTVALMNGRGPFEWSKVGTDIPNEAVCGLVREIEICSVIYISGRDECCREETEEWLRAQDMAHCGSDRAPLLFMRPTGDCRDDRIIKREIYEREIKGKYNVQYVIDDRNKVVEMWRQMGLTCLQVADGDF